MVGDGVRLRPRGGHWEGRNLGPGYEVPGADGGWFGPYL